MPENTGYTVTSQSPVLSCERYMLNDSMGMSFTLLVGFSVLIYIILMYLLSKLVIEKNEQNISMLKILGYSNREASKLYNRATTVVTIGAILVSVPLIYYVFAGLYHYFMFEMKGWLPYVVPWYVFALFFVFYHTGNHKSNHGNNN